MSQDLTVQYPLGQLDMVPATTQVALVWVQSVSAVQAAPTVPAGASIPIVMSALPVWALLPQANTHEQNAKRRMAKCSLRMVVVCNFAGCALVSPDEEECEGNRM
jgi:hypothetical protein